MPAQVEFVATRKVAAGGGAAEDLTGQLFFFHANTDQLLTFFFNFTQPLLRIFEAKRILARIIINLQSSRSAVFGMLTDLQGLAGKLKMVITERVLAGPEFQF